MDETRDRGVSNHIATEIAVSPATHDGALLPLWSTRTTPPADIWADAAYLSEPPPRGGRFGSPLVLSPVHWVRPEMAVDVSYVEMAPDGLLRHVVYLGEHEDKPANEVRQDGP